MDTIISIIKKLRRFRGITQEDMADKLFLSLRAYQKIESGQTKLDTERLEQIAAVLDISVSDLVNAKANTESHLLQFRNYSGSNEAGVKNLLEEWANKLLYIIINAKGKEMSYLNQAVEPKL